MWWSSAFPSQYSYPEYPDLCFISSLVNWPELELNSSSGFNLLLLHPLPLLIIDTTLLVNSGEAKDTIVQFNWWKWSRIDPMAHHEDQQNRHIWMEQKNRLDMLHQEWVSSTSNICVTCRSFLWPHHLMSPNLCFTSSISWLSVSFCGYIANRLSKNNKKVHSPIESENRRKRIHMTMILLMSFIRISTYTNRLQQMVDKLVTVFRFNNFSFECWLWWSLSLP